jgi:DNA methyltransferase 1-associated protein 1
MSTTKAAHQPVFLRSFKLPLPKTVVAPKIMQLFSELGIRHDRIVMPTRENCQQFESLMDAAGALVDTRRVVDKTQHEINVLKARLGIRASEGAEETGERDVTPMDVDETGGNGEQDAEGEPDDERAQSVVSTRSGRSRKHVGHLNLRTSGTAYLNPP